jgi:FkbM family methyltransferase
MKTQLRKIGKKLFSSFNDQESNFTDMLSNIAHLANEAKNGRYYPLSDGSILTTIYTGQIIAVDPSDLSLAPHLILKGEWEKELTQRCETIVSKMENPVIFDVGANFGWYGLTLSRFSNHSTIHFFEANPDIANLLSKTVLVNGLPLRAEINNLAVSDQSGEVLCLEVPKLHKGSSSICGFSVDLSQYYEAKEDFSKFEVTSTSLDEYCQSKAIHAVDFMKIDVEGAEEKVVAGAEKTIRRSENLAIMLEWNIGRYTDTMLDIMQCFQFCAAHNRDGDWTDLSEELRLARNISTLEGSISSKLNTSNNHYDLFFGKKSLA